MDTTTERIPKSLLKRRDELPEVVEHAVSKIPASAFLAFGIACCAASTGLALKGRTRHAIMLGNWASMALLTGLYFRK